MLKRDSLFAIVEFQSLRKSLTKHHHSGGLRPAALGRRLTQERRPDGCKPRTSPHTKVNSPALTLSSRHLIFNLLTLATCRYLWM